MFCLQKSQERAWRGRKGRDYSCAESLWVTQPKTLPVWFRSFSKSVEQALTADMTTLGTHTSRQNWKWGQENPSWTFSALTGRNSPWLASVAAALPSLTQDGGQGWNREGPGTHSGGRASGPGHKTRRTEAEKHWLGIPTEVSASTGTPPDRKRKSCLCSSAYAHCLWGEKSWRWVLLQGWSSHPTAWSGETLGPAPIHHQKGLFPTVNHVWCSGVVELKQSKL